VGWRVTPPSSRCRFFLISTRVFASGNIFLLIILSSRDLARWLLTTFSTSAYLIFLIMVFIVPFARTYAWTFNVLSRFFVTCLTCTFVIVWPRTQRTIIFICAVLPVALMVTVFLFSASRRWRLPRFLLIVLFMFVVNLCRPFNKSFIYFPAFYQLSALLVSVTIVS